MKRVPVMSNWCIANKCINCPGYVLVDGEKRECEHGICKCNSSIGRKKRKEEAAA
jgi:hypothetical protein